MDHDPRAWLYDVCVAIDHISSFISGRSYDDYLQDTMFRSAVERQLEIVGEALTHFARENPEASGRIPDLRSAVGMRNVIIHGYRTIDPQVVWRAVHRSLPRLHAQIRAALDSWPPPG
jgi:uncharacterized protein with HEPN domain